MKSDCDTHAAARWVAALLASGLIVLAACSGSDPAEPARPEDASCQPLGEFETFRYEFDYKIHTPKPEGPVDEKAVGQPPFAITPTLDSVTLHQVFDGAYQRPDAYMISIDTLSETGETSSAPIEEIFIGDQAWVNLGQWTESEVPNVYRPTAVCETILSALDLTGISGNQETIDGESVTHFRLDTAELDAAATLFGPGSDQGRLVKTLAVDVWLAEEGWPVRIEARGEGSYPSGRVIRLELSQEIRDVDSDDIDIRPPA